MAILATQRVLTHNYWKFAYDLVEGDILFDLLGNPVQVKLVQQYRAQRCYEVHFDDGLTVCGDDHLKLPLENSKYRKRVHQYKGRRQFSRPLQVTALSELTEMPLRNERNRIEYTLPAAQALKLATQDLPVPPFVFGFWFFNRRKNGMMAAPAGTEDFVYRKFKESGYVLTEKWKKPNNLTTFITKPTIQSHLVPHIPTSIPNNYLLSSATQRLELLRGIMHSKSRRYSIKRDEFRLASKSKAIVKQVQYLAESLGCKTVLEDFDPRNGYILFIKTRLQLIENQVPKPTKVRQNWRSVTDITELPSQACVHIETNSPNTGFLVGEGFIACH